MNERNLTCPHCGNVFSVDGADYASLLNQVKNAEFANELKERETQLRKQLETEQRNQSLLEQQKHKDELNAKQAEIEKLKSQISGYDETKKAEIEADRAKKDAEISELKAQLSQSEGGVQLAVSKVQAVLQEQLHQKEMDIEQLKNQVKEAKTNGELERTKMKIDYEKKLTEAQKEVDYYKDLKARLSTKMIGESLETYCSNEFNKVRAQTYPNAYFEKDNEVKNGSKGDFIFKDYANGMEYISIMFDMKNEADETATKHKNEDFFAKLDKDRKAKGCEYAVLVSLLEQDNELYNNGIVDVSYRYPKMYVVRPQFFMPIISLLSTASHKSIHLQQELAMRKKQNVDVTNFENQLTDFKDKFGKQYRWAASSFNEAIKDIDNSIKSLEKVKASLLTSVNHLRSANNHAENLTIRKLTANNPTMKAKFDEARQLTQEAKQLAEDVEEVDDVDAFADGDFGDIDPIDEVKDIDGDVDFVGIDNDEE